MIKSLYNTILKNIKGPVFKNMFIVGSITLLIKGVAFYKETVVASSFGLSELLDTFFIAMIIPGLINNVFIGSYRSVFIPNYVAELKSGRDVKSFQSTGFLVTLCISILFVLISILLTDVYLENLYPNHTEEYYNLIKTQFYIVLPCLILWGLSSLLKGLLNIDNEFTWTSLGGIIGPIPIIVCLFYFNDVLGVSVLAVGTLIGSILGFVYVLVLALKRKVIHLGKPDFKSEGIRFMFKQIPAKVSSSFFTGILPLTDQYFAAMLIVGSVASLNYGLKIPAVITGILIIAISNVLLPHFSKLAIENKANAFKVLFKNLKITFAIAATGAISLIFISSEIISLFFEKGAFTAENTAVVSKIQIIFLIYTPFTICGMILVNFLTSINKNAFMAYVSFGAMILNFILDYILVDYYGVFGIAICTTCVYVIRSLVLFSYTLNQKKLIS